MSAEFTRTVRFYPSYDHRDEPGERRGAGGARLAFQLAGPLGVVVASINTGWMARPYLGTQPAIYAPRPLSPRGEKPGMDRNLADNYPTAGQVDSHSPVQRQDYEVEQGPCDVLGSDTCWGQTGYLIAEEFFQTLVSEGDEAAWTWLADTYESWLRPEVSS